MAVADVTTRDPASIERSELAAEAARCIAANDSGHVIVQDHGTVCGVPLADLGISIRSVALDNDRARR